MTKETKAYTIKLPEPSLRRLPWYLAYAKLAKERGEEHISSTQISNAIGVDSSQIAKDLSFINLSGKTRVGYEVVSLVEILEDFLGFTTMHKACIFGVGSLGGALLHDSGLTQYGLRIVAGFDVKQELNGTTINHIPVYDLSKFAEMQKSAKIEIGVLTVPVDKAQYAAEQMIAGGIKAIWNFTPFRIIVPKHIVVQNTSIYSNLAVMFNRLNHTKAATKKEVK